MDHIVFPSLAHLQRMTDDTGMLQFATYGVPSPHSGYTLDDNVRALLVAIGYYHAGVEQDLALALSYRYLSFMHWAQRSDGRFHNEAAYDRSWLDDVGSDDAQGRAVWALGYATAYPIHRAAGDAAATLLNRALPMINSLRSLRSRAYYMLGLSYLVRAGHPLADTKAIAALADSLIMEYEQASDAQWRWFEPILVYDNGRLPQALLLAGHVLGEQRYLDVGGETLDWLLGQVVEDDLIVPVGQDGWFPRGQPKARYDQQPIDAAVIAEVGGTAHTVLGDERYRHIAQLAWRWFHGHNSEGLPLFDPQTGGCHDGLERGSVNGNQGAESLLALLQTALALRSPSWLGVG